MTTNNSNTPTAKYLKDYQSPDYLIPFVELVFNLEDNQTLVKSKLTVERQNESATHIELDSGVKSVNSVIVDGRLLDKKDYKITDDKLLVPIDAVSVCLEIESVVDPANNTSLEGLYKSSGVYCTQCEAEGFRKITPFLDRPDVLSVYTVTIFAEKAEFPYLLSNGNDVDSGVFEEGDVECHWVKWHDPHPKPCYLFALVAGDFDCLTDEFRTVGGREVKLELFVDKGNLHLSQHAMDSLKKSMKWDEDKYGLEYDLDKYMIVAVDFFNMGAMENKGLNVFNSKYVLADEATATDNDYHGVEAVIAHEYFHNWTGNRVTCRDWFQLSMKEGLTVFRDQQFSADMGSEVLERIKHANVIRTMQFAEDAGPMAHPIRPQKVIEMNNFYTVTVYDKGAEVIRMMNSLLGESKFRAGMDLYFERHDGQAVTCDDFVNAMADASGQDLTLFKNWYQQAGTPVVAVESSWNNDLMRIKLSQSIPTRESIDNVLTLMIPVKYELLSKTDGKSLQRGTLILEQNEQEFELACAEDAHLVLFENFSAPVKVNREIDLEDTLFMASHASDPFCRWDLLQSAWVDVIKQAKEQPQLVTKLVSILARILVDDKLSSAVKAELLCQPSFEMVAQTYQQVDVEQILENKNAVATQFASEQESALRDLLASLSDIDNGYQTEKVAKRKLRSVLLSYLGNVVSEENQSYLEGFIGSSKNMTESMGILDALRTNYTRTLQNAVEKLEQDFSGSVLVLDKIFSLIGRIPSSEVYELMSHWSKHESFTIKNPNRVRALYGAFISANPKQFHDASGKGYEFLTDLLIQLDEVNPQVAARMITPLLSWKRFDANRQSLMQKGLQRLAERKLSKDLFEKVSSALA